MAALAACCLAAAVLWTTAINSEANRRAAAAIADERIERARHWTEFTLALQQLVIDLGWALGCVVVGGLAVLVLLVAVGYWQKAHDRRYRAQDGMFALQSIRVAGGRLLVDPNRMVGAVLFASSAGVLELPAAAGWEAQVQVTAGAQRVALASALGDVRYAAHGKLLAGHYDKAPSVVKQLPEPSGSVETQQRPIESELIQSVNGVLSASTRDAFLLGQNRQSGKLAVFDVTTSVHAGIIGVTGTGKTASCGYVLVAQALRHGWHVVILDPKGGADWRIFAPAAEWHESDDLVFGDQIASLEREHQRRQGMAAAGHAASVRDIVCAPASMLVVIEEYGDLIRSLRRRDNKAATLVDDMLDTLMRRARSSDMHLVFIDQYPEHWSHQVIGGTKFKAVFQLGPNQGAKVEEYKAASLPDRGEFLVKGQQYTAWNGAKAVPKWLVKQSFASVESPVIDGEYSVRESVRSSVRESVRSSVRDAFAERSPEVDPPVEITNAPTNATPVDEAGWLEWTLAEYLSGHPELLQVDAQGRGVGIRELARAMATVRYGDAGRYELMKSTASTVAAQIRRSVRVDGAPLGVDVTVKQ